MKCPEWKSTETESKLVRSSHCGAVETNLITIHEEAGSIPGLDQWVKNPALLWAVVWFADAAWLGIAMAVA